MASGLRPSLIPQCSACARRFAAVALDGIRPSQQQVRGKAKTVNRSETIHVRLLYDEPRYGPAGAVVPVNRSFMRNHLFPSRRADYIAWDKLRDLRRSNTPMERNKSFGLQEDEEDDLEDSYTPLNKIDVRPIKPIAGVEITQLTPERTHELLEIFLPPTITFNRTPQTTEAASSAVATVAANSPIYGSVSTADVAQEISRNMARNDEAQKVQVSEADIRFVIDASSPAAADSRSGERVKFLGEYELEIRVKGLSGGSNMVHRKVKVVV